MGSGPAIPVGQFATITHLSVKTLRYYHEVGLLPPSHIDEHSGDLYYHGSGSTRR